MVTTDSGAWIAFALGLVVPGLGHASRRHWLRSLVWFLTVVGAVTLLLYDAEVGSLSTVSEVIEAVRTELSPPVQAGLLGLHLIQAVDAFSLGSPEDAA